MDTNTSSQWSITVTALIYIEHVEYEDRFTDDANTLTYTETLIDTTSR